MCFQKKHLVQRHVFTGILCLSLFLSFVLNAPPRWTRDFSPRQKSALSARLLMIGDYEQITEEQIKHNRMQQMFKALMTGACFIIVTSKSELEFMEGLQLPGEVKSQVQAVKKDFEFLYDKIKKITGPVHSPEQSFVYMLYLLQHGEPFIQKIKQDIKKLACNPAVSGLEINKKPLKNKLLDMVKYMDTLGDFPHYFVDTENKVYIIEVNELLNKCFTLFWANIPNKARKDNPLYIKANPVLIIQAILNLLEKAKCVAEESAGVSIKTSARNEGSDVIIEISGNFTKQKEHGTGLGLAIAEKIIKDHGGTIHIEANPGEWTAYIRLPAANLRDGKAISLLPGAKPVEEIHSQTDKDEIDHNLVTLAFQAWLNFKHYFANNTFHFKTTFDSITDIRELAEYIKLKIELLKETFGFVSCKMREDSLIAVGKVLVHVPFFMYFIEEELTELGNDPCILGLKAADVMMLKNELLSMAESIDKAMYMFYCFIDNVGRVHTDVNEILKEIMEKLFFIGEILSPSRDREIKENYAIFLPYVNANPAHLYQVFLNVLRHAVWSARKNETVRLKISTRQENENVVVEVSDNRGLDIAVPDKDIFKLYTPDPEKQRQKGEDIELGMLVSEKLVNEHGGTITIEPGPNGWSTVTIRLPAAKAIQKML